MSRSHQISVAALAVILGSALWVLFMPSRNSIPAPQAEPAQTVPSKERSAVPRDTSKQDQSTASPIAKNDIQWEKIERLLGGMQSERVKPTDADVERFLAKHGTTANNLVAAFEATDDTKWLEKALELFPNAPIVLLSALSRSEAEKDERFAGWLERLKRADGKNPLPWIYSAKLFAERNDPRGVMEELKAAQERPGFYTYSNERISAAQLLYEDMGLGKLEAELVGMFSMKVPWLQTALRVSKSLEVAKKAEGADASFVQEATAMQYGLGKMFQTPEASRLMISQLVASAMEKQGMASLPEEDQVRRNAALQALRDEIKDSATTLETMLKAHDSTLFAGYVRKVRTEGELSAFRWLKTQQK